MATNDNYPPGAEHDPFAPWNEHEKPERDFDLEISESVTHKVTITTTNYNQFCEYDDERGWVITQNVDWEREYKEQFWSIPYLLEQMCELLKKWKPSEITKSENAIFNRLIEESEGWKEDFIEIINHD